VLQFHKLNEEPYHKLRVLSHITVVQRMFALCAVNVTTALYQCI